jgi:site-specific DNA recombinase
MEKKKVRAALYVRVMSDDPKEQAIFSDLQLVCLEEYCEQHSIQIYKEYVDIGMDGSNINRLDLQRMLNDADQRLFDEVIVVRISRVAQKVRILNEIVDFLEKRNITLRSVEENLESGTPLGNLTIMMLGATLELGGERKPIDSFVYN